MACGKVYLSGGLSNNVLSLYGVVRYAKKNILTPFSSSGFAFDLTCKHGGDIVDTILCFYLKCDIVIYLYLLTYIIATPVIQVKIHSNE